MVVERELDHDLGLAGHLAAQAQVVAEIDHVHHGAAQGIATLAIGQLDALGAHAALHCVAHRGAVDIEAAQTGAVFNLTVSQT